MSSPLVIDYYTDILCVWAWIAQRRIDELHRQLQGKIELRYHYMDVFGDVPGKICSQWQHRGGYRGFAEHVQHSASGFEDAPINSRLWLEVRPATSVNAHLVLKAIELTHDKHQSAHMALILRQAFFCDALDIGDLTVLYHQAETAGLNREAIISAINNGTAMAALMKDYQQAKQQGVKGSPSYVMNNGRQTLYGNVGYRVLLANIEELLKHPVAEASWC